MDTLDKASDYVHDAADYIQENADKIVSATHYAADALGEKGEQLLDAEQKLMKSCRRYVCDNPLTSIGITLSIGFVLGRLLSNR